MADAIQDVLDRLVWVVYVDLGYVSNKKDEIIKRLDVKYKKFSKLNNGINHTLAENLKLIKYILKYQETHSNDEVNVCCNIVDVKGNLMINPISKVLYYDYLGLDYLRAARKAINEQKVIGEDFGEQWLQYLKNQSKFSKKERRHIEFLLEESQRAFEEAMEIIEGDILWEGYIKYNYARVVLLNYIFGFKKTSKKEVLHVVKESVRARQKVLILCSSEESYLYIKLKGELKAAEILYNNIKYL